MTLLEVTTATKLRISEVDPDEIVDPLVLIAINAAYIGPLAKLDPRMSSVSLTPEDGYAILPDDLDTIYTITPELVHGERRVGNSLLSTRTIEFKILYSYIRDELAKDKDELDLNPKYKLALTAFAAYVYFVYRKKPQQAQEYLQEFQMLCQNLDPDDRLGEETVQDTIIRGTSDSDGGNYSEYLQQ